MVRSRWLLTLLLIVSLGCGRKEQKADAPVGQDPTIVVAAPPTPSAPQKGSNDFEVISLFSSPAEPANPKYDAALTQALTRLAEQDYANSLKAFEAAQAEKDTDFVRGEIAKLKSRVDADSSAKKTINDIQSLLDAGNPKLANQLINDALKEFGSGADAFKLVQLQAQADALLAAGGEDPKVRFTRFRDQGQVALQDDNLRVAAGAFQQALLIAEDAKLQEQLRDVQARLDKYETLRTRAAELRRNPANLEDAIAVYRKAGQTWNTPEVRQDLDDCAFALQRRRDTLAVIDFETLGDVGVPAAGQTIAEELLPTFKARFDLVERDQLGRALQELNLGAGIQTNADQQREVGKLARARFLVLGSVQRNGDITARARIVDTGTGLIVQTAKVTAPTFEQLIPRLPELTKQLLMSDDEKLAFVQQQLQAANKFEPLPVNAPLPPPPAAAAGNAVPGPWLNAAAPPAFGPLQVAQFQALPAPPAQLPAQQPVLMLEPPPDALRAQLIAAVVQLGDGYFVRGQYRLAYQQYEFALSLAPNEFAIRARLEQCRPLLTPVFVVAPARPRLAILNFYVVGNLPPGLSVGVPELLAPYFAANYEIVDQGQVYWMMARLGLTQADLMRNAHARRWLGRSLGIQAYLMGTVQHTASFDVNTYLITAEQGWLQGAAHMHVRNSFELKMHAGELAQFTQMPPAQRAQYVAAEPQVNLLVGDGRGNLGRGNFLVAIKLFESALVLRPGNVQATLLLNQARESQRRAELEETRRREAAAQRALETERQRRQRDIALAAEAARIEAARQAGARAEAERHAAAERRAKAYADMVARARSARDSRNFTLAASLYQGALDLTPPTNGSAPPIMLATPHEVLVKELAQARADLARANEEKAKAEQALHDSALRQKRDAELTAARQKLEDERHKREAAAAGQRQAIDAKYQAAFDQGQALMAQKKYEAAIVALQGARQLKKTEVVEAMLATAVAEQAKASAAAKGDIERKQFEDKLAEEHKRKKAADDQAKRNHDQYDASLKSANDALVNKDYDAAESHLQSAGRLFSTDAVKSKLREVQSARLAGQAAARTEKERSAKADRVKQYLDSATTAQASGNFDDSLQKLEQARKLDPTNVEVLAALTQAQQARERALRDAALKSANDKALRDQALLKATQDAAAKKALQESQAAKEKAAKIAQEEEIRKSAAARKAADETAAKEMAAKEKAAQLAREDEAHKDAARKAAEQAAQAKAQQEAKERALKAAADDEARRVAAQNQAAEQKRKSSYADAVQAGQRLAGQHKYGEALQALQGAKSLYPNDPHVNQLIAQTSQAWENAKRNDATQAAQKKAADDRAQYQRHLDQGQQLLNQRQFPQAAQQFEAALRFVPNDPTATRLLQQARTAKK